MNTTDRTEYLVRHLSLFLCHAATKSEPVLDQIVERLIRQTVDGHIGVDLTLQADDEPASADSTRHWRKVLLASGIAGTPGQYCPLILDEYNRLYLHRYWNYEQQVARSLRERAGWLDRTIDAGLVAKRLASLFAGDDMTGQKAAAAIAALRRLTVVSGGPGTGKTTAVVRILALLLELDSGLHVALAAPTGKAAARASEAVRRAGDMLSLSPAARERIPREAATIHRLLGLRPGYSRFNAGNPLPHDVVVIDEASMIGVSLMARLLEALRPECRLILLGDKDQLSSVEPGSILGDICSADTAYSPAFAARLSSLGIDETRTAPATHALQDCVVRLTHSFRFDSASGVGRLADAIRRGDADTALALLSDPAIPEVQLHESSSIAALHGQLAAQLPGYLRGYLLRVANGDDVSTVLASFDSFRLLCALRQGPAGVAGLNALTEQVLTGEGLIDTRETWYAGRPVMVTSNDYMLQLFNGDIGMTIRSPDDDAPRVVFESPGGPRSLHTPRLPEHMTVFAMTVHKAQGSEFDDVAFVLPDQPGELLGRELIYTAVTRARRSVTIYGRADILFAAIGRGRQRRSGLADRLRVDAVTGPAQGSLF